jgi:hypothetical protein
MELLRLKFSYGKSVKPPAQSARFGASNPHDRSTSTESAHLRSSTACRSYLVRGANGPSNGVEVPGRGLSSRLDERPRREMVGPRQAQAVGWQTAQPKLQRVNRTEEMGRAEEQTANSMRVRAYRGTIANARKIHSAIREIIVRCADDFLTSTAFHPRSCRRATLRDQVRPTLRLWSASRGRLPLRCWRRRLGCGWLCGGPSVGRG